MTLVAPILVLRDREREAEDGAPLALAPHAQLDSDAKFSSRMTELASSSLARGQNLHHPHYVGGLRALIAEGATVVTTPGNEALVRQIAAFPFRLRPDRLARSPRPLSLQTFDKRYELSDPTNRIVAVNIGDRSQHTAEFVVFWLPQARLLFETEQGWVTVNGTVRASRRAAPGRRCRRCRGGGSAGC